MNDLDVALEGFAREYRSRGIPPPHILLTGHDEGQKRSIGREFVERLGIEFAAKDASGLQEVVDLTMLKV